MPQSLTYNMDCMDFMKECKDKQFDLAIVDPPYGLGSRIVDGGAVSPFIKRQNGKVKEWDLAPDKKYFNELFKKSKNQIIFGGNYFNLPAFRTYVIWDKTIYGNSYSDCELAWTSFDSPSRIFKENIALITSEGRIHPTQKSIKLYKWLLKNYAKEGNTILDTHLGSGSSRIACYDYGFDFTGIELDKDYFEAQEKRFNNHIAQVNMFKVA